MVHETLLSLPWLLGSLVFAHWGYYPVALCFSFVFFLTGLRQVHNCFHSAMGISARANDLMMVVLSALMLGSMHAVRYNHLQHHKHCLDEHDVEGMCARMSAFRSLIFGPLFPLLLHANALQNASARQRVWIWGELLVNTILLVLVFGALDVRPFDARVLRYHYSAMIIGQCLTSFFAVWTVHRSCDRSHFIARTVRGRWRSVLTFNMFYHVEHHLFPRVPTCKLPILAARLDERAPELKNMRVF